MCFLEGSQTKSLNSLDSLPQEVTALTSTSVCKQFHSADYESEHKIRGPEPKEDTIK